MRAEWSQGYVTDAIYTDGFYGELSPARLNYVAVLKGCLPIPIDRPFTYLELGCGLGRSTTILAGAFPQGRFIGVDFNPAHIALARHHVDDLGIGNAEFLERSFQDLAQDELPVCDFIALHGVYTWVSPEARRAIRQIVRDRLRPGGLLYVSYNCQPGWSATAPLRKLMYETASENAGAMAENVVPALKLMEQLADGKLGYFRANEGAAPELRRFKERGVNYLAHEFLNADWSLFYSVDVADELAEAKVTHLGSATLPENHVDLMVDKETAELIEARPTSRMRQLLLDFAVNQRFRRDVFVRGHQQIRGAEQLRLLERIPFGSLKPEAEFTPKIRVGRGEIAFHKEYFPILKELFQRGTFTLAEMNRECAKRLRKSASLDRTVALMTAAGHIIPCAEAAPMAKTLDPAGGIKVEGKTNQAALAQALSSAQRQYFTSTLAGTGLPIPPLDALMLTLLGAAKRDPKVRHKQLLERMKARGLRFNRDGQPVRGEAEELKMAAEALDGFMKIRLPVLHRMGVVSTD